MRPLRQAFPGGLYEISIRVTGQHLLLTPGKPLNDLVIGVIGRAQLHCNVQIHAFVVLSNHYHMLISVPDNKTLSKFQWFVNGYIARKVNRILDRKGTFWERRFRAIPVVGDRFTQMWRLRYILAHGVKEGLVGRVDDWPGVSSTPWLRDGSPICGIWTSHTDETNAKRRKDYVEVPGQFDTVYVLRMTPLPCFAETSEAQWRAQVRELIDEVHAESDAKLEATNSTPVGREGILANDPFARVLHSKHGRAPSVLSLDMQTRRNALQHLRTLAGLWRDAAVESLMASHLTDGGKLQNTALPVMTM